MLSFWDAMRSNNFHKASEWLSEEFECFWPQSSELIVGPKNFAEINSQYPSNGVWQFHLNTIVVEGNQVVTDVSVTDGTQHARAITFHTVENGLICKQIEFWPDNFEAQEWREKWVKNI